MPITCIFIVFPNSLNSRSDASRLLRLLLNELILWNLPLLPIGDLLLFGNVFFNEGDVDDFPDSFSIKSTCLPETERKDLVRSRGCFGRRCLEPLESLVRSLYSWSSLLKRGLILLPLNYKLKRLSVLLVGLYDYLTY